MKKLFAALFCLPSIAWATYIPVNGSTISIEAMNGNAQAIPVSGTLSVNALPTGTNNIGTVTGSSVTIIQGGTALTATSSALDINIKSGSIANTGFNVTNQPNVYLVNPATVSITGIPNVYTTNLTTVTFNGVVQPVSVNNTGVWVDSTSYTVGTSSVIPGGGLYLIQPSVLVSTAMATHRISPWRAQYVTLMDNAGVILGTSTSNALQTYTTNLTTISFNGVAQPVSQSGAFSIANSSFNVYTTNLTTVTFNGAALPTGTNNIGTVSGSSVTLVQSGIAIAQANGALQNYTTNITTVTGTAAVGASAVGNPIYTGVLVTSATMPTGQTDAKMQALMSDQFGRAQTNSCIPWEKVSYATATLTASTTQTVFISSAGVGTFINLIGCIGVNTSATNTFVTFYPVGNATSNSNSVPLGMPANDVPVGAFPPSCQFLRSNANSDIMIQGNDSVSSLLIKCEYYTSL